jgi:hypothetical protein
MTLGDSKIIYKCKPFEELSMFTDQSNDYIFLKVNEFKNNYAEKILVL